MGSHHARIYKKMRNLKLVGLGEKNEDTARAATQKFEVPVYSDYRTMLEKERPQVVSVATPASQHEEITIAALQAGAHVIVEKPIAITLEGAARMIATARQVNRKLMVGHIERFSPIMQKLKVELNYFNLGSIHKIISRRFAPYPARIQDVGLVLDTAIHDLDLIFFLTQQLPAEISADVKYQLHHAHEDTLLASLDYEKGFSCILDINWINARKTRETIIQGDFGIFHADNITQNLTFYPRGKGAVEYSIRHSDPLELELQFFIDSLKEGKVITIDPIESFSALYLALKLLESGKTGMSQKIDANILFQMERWPGSMLTE
jgi:UDP-N-acetylglucosamine 3-dehydrogenase